MTESGSLRLPTPPTMQNHGNYVASIERDGTLARGEGRRARHQSLHGLSRRLAPRRGEPRRGRAHDRGGPDQGRQARLELRPADGRHRAGDGARRRNAGPAGTGLPAAFRHRLAEPPDLRARREGALGDEAPARRRHPHPRLAPPDVRLRRQLLLPSRREPRRHRARRRPGLPRVLARRARPAPGDEAASRSSAPISRAARCSSGERRRSPRAAITRSRNGSTATAS